MIRFEPQVSSFLDNLNHPRRAEIDALRSIILDIDPGIAENIKWNGPNYAFNGDDRITMRIHPPKNLQLIFHRGAKTTEIPASRLISDHQGLLAWKTNDRAVADFKSADDIQLKKAELGAAIREWLAAAG